ncbi:uncharacterized protein LOC130690440 [Daphnia carinata]|uniref:uncharacterized protein LOC130690440 n=1 Tax=Daphnia carinata TaxID=120202 RepID=UPI0028683DD6|nr:uncharacterized protein LOC130690440 [Daphnia carinata]
MELVKLVFQVQEAYATDLDYKKECTRLSIGSLEKMFSCWLLFFSCFVAFVPLGCQGNHHEGSAVDSSSFDHDIYPHHSIIHTLLHRFQGHQTANDLPQNWPATPRKFTLPIYYPAHPIGPGYLFHLSHWPATFVVHKNDDNEGTKRKNLDTGSVKMDKQETAVYYPVNHPPHHHYFHRKSLPIPRLIFKPLNLIVW